MHPELLTLVLDGVYGTAGDGAPVFIEASAPTLAQLQTLLDHIICRLSLSLCFPVRWQIEIPVS